MPALFEQPFMYWIGVDIPAADPAEVDAFHTFYAETHLPEVVAANPGFTTGHRYGLLRPDPRGVLGPGHLGVYEMDGEAAARTYLARNDGPPEGRPAYTPGPPAWDDMQPRWRMIWGKVATTGAPAGPPPASVFIVGINPPQGASADEVAEMDAFYEQVHMPEVLAASGYTRATRYRLLRELLHPDPGCPTYLAVYEADAATTAKLDDPTRRPEGGTFPPGDTLSPGPAVWQAHTTPWRMTYRRLDP